MRRTTLAIAAGTIAAVPLAGLVDVPSAEARSLIALPQIQLPAKEPGYQLATVKGDVLPFGTAAGGEAPGGRAPVITGIARTKSGGGSWTVSRDGGVFTTGDAPFKGSLGDVPLRQPIVGIAATPSGNGYWLVGADGGVFAFGDASFRGSAAGEALNSRIVAISPTPTGRGYRLVAADGGVFAYGDALFYGAAAGEQLNAPVTSMATTRSGKGYWLVSADGGVFAFGDALYFGGATDVPHGKIVGIAPSRTGKGYWLASTDGGVFTFGDAPFLGSSGGGAAGKVVGIAGGVALPRVAPAPEPAAAAAPAAPVAAAAPVAPAAAPASLAGAALQNRFGHDISWPQCDGPYPVPGYGYGVIGVTGGRPFTRNRCLEPEWRWANSNGGVGSLYVNLATPKWGEPQAMNGPAGACRTDELPCQAYNHSANNMLDALAYARSVSANSPMWWLDVEVLNRWSPNTALNALTVKAAKETLEQQGVRVGVYSTWLQWRKITGDAEFGLPVWAAGVPTDGEMPAYCNRPEKAFNGGEIWMVQSIPIVYDVNYVCDPMLPHVGQSFSFPKPVAAPAEAGGDGKRKDEDKGKGDESAAKAGAKVSTKSAARSEGKPETSAKSDKAGKPEKAEKKGGK